MDAYSYFSRGYSVDFYRKQADREEALAGAATRDGDRLHAARHKAKAAEWREKARQQEVK